MSKPRATNFYRNQLCCPLSTVFVDTDFVRGSDLSNLKQLCFDCPFIYPLQEKKKQTGLSSTKLFFCVCVCVVRNCQKCHFIMLFAVVFLSRAFFIAFGGLPRGSTTTRSNMAFLFVTFLTSSYSVCREMRITKQGAPLTSKVSFLLEGIIMRKPVFPAQSPTPLFPT